MSPLALRWFLRRLHRFLRADGKWPLDLKWTAWTADPDADRREADNIKRYRSKDEWPRR